MKVLFYSNNCDFCKKILLYLDKNKIIRHFKLINIDNNKIPDNIKIVPTIIDTDVNNIMEGKLAFEYLTNIKYFNIKTNNIELVNTIPSNPIIEEDKYAQKIDIGVDLTTNTNDIKPIQSVKMKKTGFYMMCK